MSKVYVVCGPTASGKSALAIEMAKEIGAEIVCADSMQIYKEMNIGTAKPTVQEMQGIPHHMMDIISVTESYNVARYAKQATIEIDNIINCGKPVIIAGGTGLYIDSLVNNTNFFDIKNDFEYRDELKKIKNQQGGEVIHQMLQKLDPVAAEKIHQNDTKRIIRALEVIKVTGKKISDIQKNSQRERKYQFVHIGLNYSDRQVLYDRINARVDQMIKNGLLEEVETLFKNHSLLSATARAAIGYFEINEYQKGNISIETAIESIKQKTRNYAKRQITWFNKNKEILWFYKDKFSCTGHMLNELYKIL